MFERRSEWSTQMGSLAAAQAPVDGAVLRAVCLAVEDGKRRNNEAVACRTWAEREGMIIRSEP
jgi:hypothetical protein